MESNLTIVWSMEGELKLELTSEERTWRQKWWAMWSMTRER